MERYTYIKVFGGIPIDNTLSFDDSVLSLSYFGKHHFRFSYGIWVNMSMMKIK